MKKDRPITSKSIHLSASAGSGKTRALKDRYLALLDELDRRGLGLDQAVAITFTDKAAAEIKERVMQSLPEAMLKKIIRGSQDLRISTIHSFCMNLLKRYPLEAGLPPDFGVLDARDQAAKVRKAVEDALEESDRDQAIMAPLREFTTDDLVEAAEFLLSIRSRLQRMEIDTGGPEGLLQALRTGMGVEQSEAELRSLTASTAWKNTFTQMELILRSQGDLYDGNKGREHLLLAEAKEPESVYKISGVLAALYFTTEGNPRKNPAISKKAFIGKNRADYETASFAIQDLLGRFRSLSDRSRAGKEAESLLRIFQRAGEKYQEAKLREGVLDFDDLEIYAYSLLQGLESPDILYWLDRKILHFLVDEFQDTSDIQWAILDKLTEEIFAGLGTVKYMEPTLFVVGDEKQSIYRFREANYRLIENVRQKMEKFLPPETREILTLERNYRSTPAVIETVNRVFSALWGGSYKPSETERKEQQGSARLIELQVGDGGEGLPAATEAEILAREITSLIANGTTVYEKMQDPSGSGWVERKAGYGDCAILIQSRTKLKEYEDALQAGHIPYRVIGGIGFYEEDEVQALMNTLFFLWNRDDKLALAAALKSALFGLTDRDIFELYGDEQDVASALARQQPRAADLLNRWGAFAGLAPLSTLIHRIVEDSGAYVRFGRKNPQTVFNIDKLLDTARAFDRRGYTTLQDFVDWVKNIRETEQREATADMNLPGFQGSVSILTVHKAKGLEYPIVFLPGMNQQPKSLSSGPRAIVDDRDGKVRMTIKDAASPVYDELWERERGELLREHQRLLYVAMTRARDHLVMIGALADGKTPVKPDTWLDYLHRMIPMTDEVEQKTKGRVVLSSYPQWHAVAAPVQPAAEIQTAAQGERNSALVDTDAIRENLRPIPRSEMAEWKKATDFIPRDNEMFLEKLILQEGPRIVSPLTRGSVLHRCLEDYTKTGAYSLDSIVTDFPDLMMLGDAMKQAFSLDATTVLDAVLRSEQFRWVFEQRPHSYSELPFLMRKGHDIVSGMIDRVVVEGAKGAVIDYKSIRIDDDDALTAWLDHYTPQVRIYCEAIKEIFHLETVEGYLLFLDSNRLVHCSSL